MPKITFEESEKYRSGGSYFGLSDNGDTAQVQFLIDNERDIEVYATHKIETKDGMKTVNCLREPGAPISDCPLCQTKHSVSIGVYVKLLHEGKLEIWNRGKSMYEKFKNLARRFKPLSSHVIEIERVGKKGDVNTSYDFYDIETLKNIKSKEDILADFSKEDIDAVEIFGNIIKDYTFEQLEDFLRTGSFDTGEESQVRRRNRKYEEVRNSEPARRNVRKPIMKGEPDSQDEDFDNSENEVEEVY